MRAGSEAQLCPRSRDSSEDERRLAQELCLSTQHSGVRPRSEGPPRAAMITEDMQ